MNLVKDNEVFIEKLANSIQNDTFIKGTLSKYIGSSPSLQRIFIRLVLIKNQTQLSFTFQHLTKDEVKNFSVKEGIGLLQLWLGNDFLNAHIFTTTADINLRYNKKRKSRLFTNKPTFQTAPSRQHDVDKKRLIEVQNAPYLVDLGIANATGSILKEGQKKFRQINKYLEIIDATLKKHPLAPQSNIVDMGAGKGYLTFALYDLLQTQQQHLVGIELRPHLVQSGNDLAKKCGYERLSFVAQDIMDFPSTQIDMLIALHACDIATDIAIAKGIFAKAEIIIVAPCCHKQVRKAMQPPAPLHSVLKHGILAERQAELLTDGIRALLLEAHGYSSKVFEFISTEHTPKNVMIVATRSKANPNALASVQALKQQFGIEKHYLEELLKRGAD